MKVSSTQDLYNRIMKYIRTHGRLVFGATVLLCLICYLGWRESAWLEVEHLESPMQAHREKDVIGQNKNVKADKWEEDGKTKSVQNGKKHKERQQEKSSPLEEDTDKGKLICPIRNVIRPYPLLDTFAKELTGASPKAVVGADTNSMSDLKRKGKGNKNSMEGYSVHAYGGDTGRNRHEREAVKAVKAVQVQLLGIIQGEVPVAVLDINGSTHTMYEGDIVDGVQVYTIHDTKIQIQLNGSMQWIE